MIKELFTLIKLLFTSPKKVDDVKIEPMQHFPFKGYEAMMWCGRIIYRKENGNFASVVITHERIHLAQAKIKGCWVLYYLSYLWNWIKHNPFAPSSYYLNKYEGEAYANEHKSNYPFAYSGKNIKKYDLGRAYWRKYPSPTLYINYLKTL